MSNECIFCQITQKNIPANLVYEDEEIIAFNDISPKAPIHILVVPKKHIESVDKLEEIDEKLIGKLFSVAKKIANQKNLTNGYRLVINNGSDAGQTVFHIHLHLLGGQKLGSMV